MRSPSSVNASGRIFSANVAIEFRVPCAIHLTYAARTEQGEDFNWPRRVTMASATEVAGIIGDGGDRVGLLRNADLATDFRSGAAPHYATTQDELLIGIQLLLCSTDAV